MWYQSPRSNNQSVNYLLELDYSGPQTKTTRIIKNTETQNTDRQAWTVLTPWYWHDVLRNVQPCRLWRQLVHDRDWRWYRTNCKWYLRLWYSLVQFGNLMFARSYSRRPSRASLITSISSAAVCSCSVIAVLVLHCAFVRHVRGHSEFLCHLFQ